MRRFFNMKIIYQDKDQPAHSEPETKAEENIKKDITNMNGTKPPVTKLYNADKTRNDKDQ